MCDLGQRVCLIHKLRQGVRPEKRVHNRRNRLGIDQVDRSKDFIIAHIHAFTHRASHSRQPYAELIIQLLTNCAHTTITQVINIINYSLGVDQLNQVFDDFNDVFFRQHLRVCTNGQIQFAIDTEAPHISQVVTLLREKQIVDHLSGTGIICRICIPQLTIDIQHSFLLRITRILLQRIVDNRVIRQVLIPTMQQDVLCTRVYDSANILLIKLSLTVNDHIISLNRNNLTRVFIHKILNPCLQHTRSQFAPDVFLQIGLRNLHLLSQMEDLQDVFIALISNGAKQSRNRELLLPINVCIHDIINVRSKLNPRPLKRNNSSRIKFRPISMHTLTEKHTRRTMQLRNDHALSPINDKGPPLCHIRNRT